MADNTLKDLALFNLKNEALRSNTYLNVDEISFYTFFELIFNREGYDDYPFEQRMCSEYCSWVAGEKYEDRQPFVYNALLLGIMGSKGTHHIALKDDEYKGFIASHPFCITSPITYVGRSRNAKNARYLFAFAFDLDGVGMDQLHDLDHQIRIGVVPPPNIVVNSGHGLHLYYLLAKPVALFKDAVEILQKLKHALTDVIWNLYTSDHKTKQFQGIYQGFRVPTSQTKFGASVTAFAPIGKPNYWTCSQLNDYIRDPDDKLSTVELNRLDKGQFNPNRLTRKRAKELYPDWYERVVIKGDKTPQKWHVNRGLYDWWIKKLRHRETKVVPGHRYFCLLALACFGIKCQIPQDEVRQDIFSFVADFDAVTDKEDNHFTEKDAEDAYKAYNDNYCTFPRHSIERLTGIRIDPNKRNNRKRKEHLQRARIVQTIDYPNGEWRNKEGRPKGSKISAEKSSNAKKIVQWRRANPKGNKSECARDLGVSRPTVIKWWNSHI